MKKKKQELMVPEGQGVPAVPEEKSSFLRGVKKESFRKATGAADQESQVLLLYRCLTSCGYFEMKNPGDEEAVQKSLVNTLEALEPKDAMEGRLNAQIYTTQERGMQLLESSQHASSVEHRNLYINMATKLFRTANETVETLQKWRRNGAQTVVVQHVNVEGGGKAIVGGNMVAGGGQ